MLFLCIAIADDYKKIEEHMNEMKTTACNSNSHEKDIAVMSTSKCTHVHNANPLLKIGEVPGQSRMKPFETLNGNPQELEIDHNTPHCT